MPRPSDDRSDEELLVAARRDEDAFGVFYERRLNAILAFFFRRTGDRESAADLTAETFAAALIGVASYDVEQSPAVPWLFMIAHRRLVDALRRGKVEDGARRKLGLPPLVLTDQDLERVEERIAAAQHGDVLAMLERLSAEYRDAVHGRVVNEESYADLARRLECSESLVRQRVHRGLSQLRRGLRRA